MTRLDARRLRRATSPGSASRPRSEATAAGEARRRLMSKRSSTGAPAVSRAMVALRCSMLYHHSRTPRRVRASGSCFAASPEALSSLLPAPLRCLPLAPSLGPGRSAPVEHCAQSILDYARDGDAATAGTLGKTREERWVNGPKDTRPVAARGRHGLAMYAHAGRECKCWSAAHSVAPLASTRRTKSSHCSGPVSTPTGMRFAAAMRCHRS